MVNINDKKISIPRKIQKKQITLLDTLNSLLGFDWKVGKGYGNTLKK